MGFARPEAMGAAGLRTGDEMMHPGITEAERVATAIAMFEARSGLTSREFEERYAAGEFRGVAWALAWHGLTATRPAAAQPVALAR